MSISVVIPCFNAARHVERAVESIWKQEILPIDICLVDNNSEDNTWQVLQSLKSRSPSLISIGQEFRRGASIARNTGAAMTSGEWLQFLDADDELLPKKWTRQLALIQQNSKVDVVLGTPVEHWADGTEILLDLWLDQWKGLLHGSHCGQTTANLYRRSKWQEIDGWDEQLQHAQDTDLLARLMMTNAQFIHDNEPAAIYHWGHDGQLTARHPRLAFQSHVEVKIRVIEHLKARLPKYWADHKNYLYAALYSQIRMLATYDPVLAARYYDSVVPADFELQVLPEFRTPRWEVQLINRFGVERYASSKNKLKTWLPQQTWEALKKKVMKI